MDINELNKMNLVAQFSKLISQNNFVGGEESSFAGLLEKNTNVKSVDASEVDKAEVSQRPENDKKEKVEKKENAPREDKVEEKKDVEKEKTSDVENDRGEQNLEDDQKEKQEKNRASIQEGNVFAPVAANVLSEAEVAEVSVSEILSAETSNNISSLVEDILSGKVQLLDAEGTLLPISDITMENLAEMENLTLVNMQTSEKIQINGADLAQKIADFQMQAPIEVAEDDAVLNLAVADKTGLPNKKSVNNEVASLGEEETVDVQVSSELNASEENPIEKLLDDKQIKVDINVKEEKNSYFAKKELVKNSLSLQEAENQDAQNISNVAKSTQPTQSGTASHILNNNQVATQMVSPLSEDKAVAQNIAVTEVKQASAANVGNHNVMSGAEFVATTKAEAVDKGNQTSFRDVYKGMSKEAVEQVKVNITKSAVKGVDTIEVRLKPEDLGHIEIKMQIKDGKLQAHIISSRPETMEALQRDAQVLEKAFNDAGFQTDGNSLSFSFRNDGNQAQGQNDQLRNFIGKVFEQEANSDVITAEAANQNWTAETGLNIRV